MHENDLQTQLDAYLDRFTTFAAPPLAVTIPGRRGRRLNLLAAVAVAALVVAIIATPIVLLRLQGRHTSTAGPTKPTANISPRPPLRHNGQLVMGLNGSLIAFDPASGDQHVILRVPTGGVASPAYSPDGTKLAYLRGQFDSGGRETIDSIWVLDTTTGRDRQLTTCHLCSPSDSISWSPDSTRLAFSETDQLGSLQLHLIDADGTHRTQLTHFPPAQNATQPTWSPDGTHIAFTFFTIGNVPTRGETFPTVNLDVISSDGSGLAVLFAVNTAALGVDPSQPYLYPAWSPDGSRIAYVLSPPAAAANGEGQYQVWLMNPDGSHRTQIFENPRCCRGGGSYDGLAWSPDATRIAADFEFELWVMNADGSASTSHGPIDQYDRPAWQPVP